MVNSLYRLQQAVAKVTPLSPTKTPEMLSSSASFPPPADNSRIGRVSGSCCRCSLLLSGGTALWVRVAVKPALGSNRAFVLRFQGLQALMSSSVQPLLQSVSDSIEAIIITLHQEDFSG